MGAFEMMGSLDARHREENGITPARLLNGRAGDLACAMIPMSRVKPVLRSRYLVKGWLDRGAMSVVYGESNVGKTFLALDLATHVAAGLDWHGHRVPTGEKWAGPVLYIASEGGTGIRNRLDAMRREKPELDGDNLVLLPTDDDGDRVTSAVVTPAEAVTRKPKVRLTGTDKIGLQALSDALAEHGAVRQGDMFPRSRQCVPLERWRELCDRHSLSSGEGDSSKRTAFHKLKNRLQDKEIVRIVDGFVWKVEPDDHRSQSRGNAVPARGNVSQAPFPQAQGTQETPANAGPIAERSHRSLTVPGNTGNAGHTAVPAVPALYKSGNEGTLTQPGNVTLSSSSTSETQGAASRLPDPEAYDPEMWQ